MLCWPKTYNEEEKNVMVKHRRENISLQEVWPGYLSQSLRINQLWRVEGIEQHQAVGGCFASCIRTGSEIRDTSPPRPGTILLRPLPRQKLNLRRKWQYDANEKLRRDGGARRTGKLQRKLALADEGIYNCDKAGPTTSSAKGRETICGSSFLV